MAAPGADDVVITDEGTPARDERCDRLAVGDRRLRQLEVAGGVGRERAAGREHGFEALVGGGAPRDPVHQLADTEIGRAHV